MVCKYRQNLDPFPRCSAHQHGGRCKHQIGEGPKNKQRWNYQRPSRERGTKALTGAVTFCNGRYILPSFPKRALSGIIHVYVDYLSARAAQASMPEAETLRYRSDASKEIGPTSFLTTRPNIMSCTPANIFLPFNASKLSSGCLFQHC